MPIEKQSERNFQADQIERAYGPELDAIATFFLSASHHRPRKNQSRSLSFPPLQDERNDMKTRQRKEPPALQTNAPVLRMNCNRSLLFPFALQRRLRSNTKLSTINRFAQDIQKLLKYTNRCIFIFRSCYRCIYPPCFKSLPKKSLHQLFPAKNFCKTAESISM